MWAQDRLIPMPARELTDDAHGALAAIFLKDEVRQACTRIACSTYFTNYLARFRSPRRDDLLRTQQAAFPSGLRPTSPPGQCALVNLRTRCVHTQKYPWPGRARAPAQEHLKERSAPSGAESPAERGVHRLGFPGRMLEKGWYEVARRLRN